jgi:hypothetical protein
MKKLLQSAVIGLACVTASAGVLADAVADFYTGKDVELYIGYKPGGGYDGYARLIARHMGKHIPGNPNVVPKNMPGAGSVKLLIGSGKALRRTALPLVRFLGVLRLNRFSATTKQSSRRISSTGLDRLTMRSLFVRQSSGRASSLGRI